MKLISKSGDVWNKRYVFSKVEDYCWSSWEQISFTHLLICTTFCWNKAYLSVDRCLFFGCVLSVFPFLFVSVCRSWDWRTTRQAGKARPTQWLQQQAVCSGQLRPHPAPLPACSVPLPPTAASPSDRPRAPLEQHVRGDKTKKDKNNTKC